MRYGLWVIGLVTVPGNKLQAPAVCRLSVCLEGSVIGLKSSLFLVLEFDTYICN